MLEPLPMRHARRLALMLLPLLLAACASGTQAEFDRRMGAYVGRPEAEVVQALGVPNRTYDADGRRLLQYDIARPSSSPAIFPSIGFGFGSFGRSSGFGVGSGLGMGFGGGVDPCVLVFESREGRVTGFNRNGPGCVLSAA